jgi:ACS family hexuronate transporter-like MFS transporter
VLRHGALFVARCRSPGSGALAPTILKETGLDARQFAAANSYFFFVHHCESDLGIDSGLRRPSVGMLMGVFIWTVASVSHGWMTGLMGFAMARALLGFDEGVTFPGGLRTAVESLPASKRARAIALSFSGGTLGGVAAPLIAVPIGIRYGWRAAFLFTGALGLSWMVLWVSIARPPFLPKTEHRALKLSWPNPLERRFWAIVFSYALPVIAPGPILALFSCIGIKARRVTSRSRGHSGAAARLGRRLFLLGWAADRYAVDNRRPVGMFLLLTACSLVLGFTTWTTSVVLTLAIISFATFIGGGFQMVALKVGSYWYPREQAAMMTGIASGSWALVNFVLLQFLGPLFNQHRYAEAWWPSPCARARRLVVIRARPRADLDPASGARVMARLMADGWTHTVRGDAIASHKPQGWPPLFAWGRHARRGLSPPRCGHLHFRSTLRVGATLFNIGTHRRPSCCRVAHDAHHHERGLTFDGCRARSGVVLAMRLAAAV